METTVNSRVQLLKTELRLNTMEFCAKAKISNGTFYNINNGENVNQKTLNSIIECLNVNPDWLMHGNGKMFNEAPKHTGVGVGIKNPWQDETYNNLQRENSRLVDQLKFYQDMVGKFMSGIKPNFHKAHNQTYYLPGNAFGKVGLGVGANI